MAGDLFIWQIKRCFRVAATESSIAARRVAFLYRGIAKSGVVIYEALVTLQKRGGESYGWREK